MTRKRPDKTVRLGLMGGTFNPIHYGHLGAADEALSRFSLDEIIFVPCGLPPHKDSGDVADAEDRYLMTVLAVAGNPHFSVSRYEIDKREVSYTVDTMRYYKSTFPEAELYFITGADAVLELDSWKDPEQIFTYGNLIGATRPGYTVEKAPEVAGRALWMDMPALGTSATEIRRRLKEERPVTYLLPPGVLAYIVSRDLYKG